MKLKRIILLTGLAAIVVIIISSSLFVIDQAQYCIVTRFGNPIRTITEPGLYVKFPDPVDTAKYFDNRLQFYETGITEVLTADKKNIVINTYLNWKVTDPQKYWRAIRTKAETETILKEISGSLIGAAISRHLLSEFISTQPEEVKTAQIMKEVTSNCNAIAGRDFGIEIADVRLKQLNLPPQNKQSVFTRMQTERHRIAKKYRSEGQEEAIKVRALADKEKTLILSEAYRKAEKIRGEGEAQSINIYAKSFSKDREFYEFMKSLQSYEKMIDQKTTLVLSLDSELMKYFKDSVRPVK